MTVFSKGYGVATEQLNKINEALNGYREPNGQIKAVFVSGIAPDMHDQDTGIYQKSIDLTFYTRSE
ncbi:hypothetical protein JCM19039_1998 [Geomicrobium sp. JCM 19039]|nr:hypothetical protein JCM19039_1998 [Geomicrobium sp. JCM 19039]